IAAKLGRPTSISQPLGAPTLTTYDERTLPVRISRGELLVKQVYEAVRNSKLWERTMLSEASPE
ncbi:MAG TPA: hypothetical protein DCY13_04350, partial [Verrucomicrobiales bacterium]|nr:hypothetical protein [Verrucomicrobiales bacterium]